jgi:hypothetical protein
VNGSVPLVFVAVASGAAPLAAGALTVCCAPLTDVVGLDALVIVCRVPLTAATAADGCWGVSGTALGGVAGVAGVLGVLGVAGVPTGTITVQ